MFNDLFRVCARIYETLQLIESYRIIIDTTTALSTDPSNVQGRPPSLETLQRISQSAALGLRLLGSTVGTDPPGTAPLAEPPAANPGSAEEGDAAAKRQARPTIHLLEAWSLKPHAFTDSRRPKRLYRKGRLV
jgi:hypothetical protein